jgi:hypothetical protein
MMSLPSTLNQSHRGESVRFTRDKLNLVEEMKTRLKDWFKKNNNEGSVWKLDIVFNRNFMSQFSRDEQANVIKEFAEIYLRELDDTLINNNHRSLEGHIRRRTRNIYVLEDKNKFGSETELHIHWLLYINPENKKFAEELIHQISRTPDTRFIGGTVTYFPEMLATAINVERITTPRRSVYGNATYIELSEVEGALTYRNKNHGIGDETSRFELGEITYS